MNLDYDIVPISISDRPWVNALIKKRWGSESVVSRGTLYIPALLSGFICTIDNNREGLITYHLAEGQCQIVSLDSNKQGIGIGSLMLSKLIQLAKSKDCHRIWLITTNDNINALRFYQKRGFHIVAVYVDSVRNSRKLKEEIPLVGDNGIPVRDEIELEMILNEK